MINDKIDEILSDDKPKENSCAPYVTPKLVALVVGKTETGVVPANFEDPSFNPGS